jgi:hypothetical protein
MQSATYHLSITAARADALFVSALQRSDEPSTEQVRQAVAATVRAFGVRGCAARVAQAYGDHPETAALRMRWARAAVTGVCGATRSSPCVCLCPLSAPCPAPATQPEPPPTHIGHPDEAGWDVTGTEIRWRSRSDYTFHRRKKAQWIITVKEEPVPDRQPAHFVIAW